MDYTMRMSPQHTVLVMGLFTAVLMFAAVCAKECEPTPMMFEGTHLKPITQAQVDIGKELVAPDHFRLPLPLLSIN